jgi:hypothetical protein
MANYVSDFFQFIKEVLSRWPDLAIGGGLGFAWLLFEKITGRPISLKIFFVLLSVAFLFAVFHAWREQYVKSAPKLKGEMNSIVSGSSPDGKSAGILVLMGITNTGPPSIADGFDATVKFGDSHINLGPSYLTAENRFFFGAGSGQIKSSEMLYEKLVSPIPQGARTRGWLYYFLDGTNVDQLRRHGFQITIRFKDVNGTEYAVSSEPLATPAKSAEYYPGAENPFLPFIGAKATNTPMPPSSTPNKETSPP